jgi:hypothetical protein
VAVGTWRVDDTPVGLRLRFVVRRTLGGFDNAEQLGGQTLEWGDLLATHPRSGAGVRALFPSRFELDVDGAVRTALHAFGTQTSALTSVNSRDTTNPELTRALAFLISSEKGLLRNSEFRESPFHGFDNAERSAVSNHVPPYREITWRSAGRPRDPLRGIEARQGRAGTDSP